MSGKMSFKYQTLCLLTYLALCISTTSFVPTRKPVIGIISTPSDFRDIYHPQDYSYIKGMYAEFIEFADATPIAIPWNLPEYELFNVLDSINGILFTGGDADLWETDAQTGKVVFTPFTKRASLIVNYAMHLNDKGIHYPVYGICQGHEVITLSLAGTPHAIDNFKHPGQLDTVELTEEGETSRMFSTIPKHLIEFMRGTKSVFYNHRYGFDLDLLVNHEILDNLFTVTARGTDDNGKEFIAAMEAKDYPIYTVQYHPERVLSEFKLNNTYFQHPEEAAEAVLLQAVFLVSEAKKNQQSLYSNEALEKYMISGHEITNLNATWPKIYFYDKMTIDYSIEQTLAPTGQVTQQMCIHVECDAKVAY